MNTLKKFYDYMEQQNYPISATFVFVYNDYNTYLNDPHLEECFDEEEVRNILDSVSDIFETVLHFASEREFIEWCYTKENFKEHVYVYTMAQYIEGFSRRTLVPAICQYFGFININADAYMSAIGCNKKTMFNLLYSNQLADYLAPTIFIDNIEQIDYTTVISNLGDYIILKPINESCCIDTIVLHKYNEITLKDNLIFLITKYGHAMVQKYIPGDEIGITVTYHNKELYALSPIKLAFLHGKLYLTHEDSYYNNYHLEICKVPLYLLEICKKMSSTLGFLCTTRFDFRYDGNNYYLFDISPNPTVNGYTSSNYAAQNALNCDSRGILRLMAFEKIFLFEPPFNSTP